MSHVDRKTVENLALDLSLQSQRPRRKSLGFVVRLFRQHGTDVERVHESAECDVQKVIHRNETQADRDVDLEREKYTSVLDVNDASSGSVSCQSAADMEPKDSGENTSN